MMSSPYKKSDNLEIVVEDCVSSPDENDDTSTSIEIYHAARHLEETGETRQVLGNPSDADVSSSDSAQTVVVTDSSLIKPTESEDVPTGTGSKLQRSPKKVFKRTKSDSKMEGDRDDDSSDETDSNCFKKSAKRIRFDVEEDIVDSRDDSRNETDIKSQQQGSEIKSDILDNLSLFSKNLQSGTFQSDIVENFSDLLMARSGSKTSPDKLKKATSETTEIVADISEDAVDRSAEAGFVHVKSSTLVAAAVAVAIRRSPQSINSNDGEETIKHIDLKVSSEEKEQNNEGKVISHETQVKTSEISNSMSNIFKNLEEIKCKVVDIKSTEHCSVQNANLVRTECSSESNLSIERMEFSSESTIERSIATNTDTERMEFSDTCIGFESMKSGNDSNTSFEKMECKSESSVSREEMEIETASVKSTDVEGMDYSSESVLVESEPIAYIENESNSNELKNIAVSNNDDSLLIQRDSIPMQSILVEGKSDEVKNINESNIEGLETQRQFSIPPILVESASNSDDVKNINESIIGSLESQRQFSIPQISVDRESNSNEVKNIIQSNIEGSTETQTAVSHPCILVKNESIIANDSGSDSNEVKNFNESNIDEILGRNERIFSIPRVDSSDTDEYEYDKNQTVVKDNKDSTTASTVPSGGQDHSATVGETSNLGNEPRFKRKKTASDEETKNVAVSSVGGSTDTQKDTSVPRGEFSDTDSNEFGESNETDSKKLKKA